jgi:hypothetical protein
LENIKGEKFTACCYANGCVLRSVALELKWDDIDYCEDFKFYKKIKEVKKKNFKNTTKFYTPKFSKL